PAAAGELPADARQFRLVPEESLLSVLVFRAGPLAKAAHNHVIASRHLSGVVLLAPDVARSRFELHVPVGLLTVDEPELRREAGPEFATQVPGSARDGTRRNMLSPAVLDGGQFPVVSAVSTAIEPAPGGALATVQVSVRGQPRTLTVPLRYEQKGDELLADGELTLRHGDLGLVPFSALLGAIQVHDEMTIRFRILARATAG
ncbi:MAG TPA: YceI family protein, partial [Steroidobacteraceae bacterium]|nr:YceI family protein [Steroidobacteraceae bacterium]